MAKRKGGADSTPQTTEKVMQTFRMPRELVVALREEAERRGLDLTGLVVRTLQGHMSWFGLPAAATAYLDADRDALGMDRTEYVVHALFHRSLTIRERGAGFDAPGADRRKK